MLVIRAHELFFDEFIVFANESIAVHYDDRFRFRTSVLCPVRYLSAVLSAVHCSVRCLVRCPLFCPLSCPMSTVLSAVLSDVLSDVRCSVRCSVRCPVRDHLCGVSRTRFSFAIVVNRTPPVQSKRLMESLTVSVGQTAGFFIDSAFQR